MTNNLKGELQEETNRREIDAIKEILRAENGISRCLKLARNSNPTITEKGLVNQQLLYTEKALIEYIKECEGNARDNCIKSIGEALAASYSSNNL